MNSLVWVLLAVSGRIIQGHKVMPRGEEEGGKEGGEWHWEEEVAWGREMEGREGERAKQKVTD